MHRIGTHLRRSIALACVTFLIPVALSADDVILKGGGKISGRILSRTDAAVEVDVGAGTVKCP